MKLRIFLLAAALALSARAQEKPAAPEPSTVIVPYDPQRRPAEQHPDRLYLPYERFLNLWEAAKKARAGEPPAPPAPVAYSLSAARYEARLEERVLQVTVRFDLFTGPPWAKIPLAFPGATVSAITLDGAPAALSGETLVVEKRGVHTLEVRLQVAREPGEMSLEWGVPKSAATLLVLTLPQPQMTATVTPGSGTVERLAEGARIVTAVLGTTEKIALELSTAPAPTVLAEPASATIRETVQEQAVEEITQASLDFAFPGATQSRFTVLLDSDVELIGLSAANLQSWTLRPQKTRLALELTLSTPAHDRLAVSLSLRRTAAPTRDGAAPAVSAAARRVDVAEVALLADETLDVSAQPGAGLRQIATGQGAPSGLRFVAAYAGPGALAYHAAPKPPRREARIEYLYQVQRRQVELFASMQLEGAKGDPLLETTLVLPPGYTVETVQSPRPHDWWRDGDRLQIRFRETKPEPTTLVLYLVRREAAEPAGLTLAPVKLEGFRKVTGDAVVAARNNVEAALQLSGAAKEISPSRAGQCFQVLPPLERQRAFEFTGQDFSGAVTLRTVTPRLLVTWATQVEAHESWLALSTRCQPTLRQGGVERLRFSLPADLPEARVASADLRETRSHVEGDRRLYELEFQGAGVSEFTIELELPHQGRASIPAPEFPEAERAAGFIVIQNGSEGEMTVDAKGLEPALATDLPWKPERLAGAKIFRVPPGAWTASVAVERLEKAAGRRAFCAWADLTTALRRDGTEWHRAVWHMQNRALQFLPVRLPEGAELVSARVAGQSVRADAATVEGGPAVLIPLIKTRPGELSYDVEAVYRLLHPPLEQQRTHDLHDPTLLGITVERTFWHLFLPSGYRVGRLDGNLDQVVGELATADKLDDDLKELHELTVIANSDGNNVETRQKAADNFDVLWSKVQTVNRTVGQKTGRGVLTLKDAPAFEKGKAANEQNSYVANKRAQVDQALQKEAEQLKGAKGELANARKPASGGNQGLESLPPTMQGYAYKPNLAWQSQPGIIVNSKGPAQAPAPPAAPANNLYLNDHIIFNNGTVSMQAGEKAPVAVNGGVLSTARGNAVANGSLADSGTLGGGSLANGERLLQQNVRDADRLAIAGTNTYAGGTTIAGGRVDLAGKTQSSTGGVMSADNNSFGFELKGTADGRIRNQREGIDQSGADGGAGKGRDDSLLKSQIQPSITYHSEEPVMLDRAKNLQLGSVPVTPAAAVPAAPGIVPALVAQQDATHDASAKPAQNAARADRRTTLAVDFPTEGEPLHFKKLKSAARLQVTLAPEETTHRLRNLALFALGALVLGVVQRHRSSREARLWS